MKVLITGGTGFIGSRLVTALVARGDRVRVLRRPESSLRALDGLVVEQVIGDILKPATVLEAVQGCDLVFHVAALASYWRATPAQVYAVNVEGTRVVMDACLLAGVRRVVHTSSVAAIGIAPDGSLANEQTPFDPLSASFAYANSKHQAEAEVRRSVERGLEAVIVNPAVVIGAGDHYLISGSIVLELARRRIPAVPPGGICVADVEAVVLGHIAAAERGQAGERYILGGENLSFGQVAAVVSDICRNQRPRRTIPAGLLPSLAWIVDVYNRAGRHWPKVTGEQIRLSAFNLFFDSSKAVRELGYPILPFRGAAESAYHWYKTNGYLA